MDPTIPDRPVTFFVTDPIPRFTRIGGYDVATAAGDPARYVGKARPWQPGDLALTVAARPFPVGEEIAADISRAADDMIAPFAPSVRCAIPVMLSGVTWPQDFPRISDAVKVGEWRREYQATPVPFEDPPEQHRERLERHAVESVAAAYADESRQAIAAIGIAPRDLSPVLRESLDWIAIRAAAAAELARLHAEVVSTGQPVCGELSAADLARMRALVAAWIPGKRPDTGVR